MVFCRNWLEGTRYLLVQEFCSALFREFLAPVSTHLVTSTAVPELTEKKFFFPISFDEEDLFFGFRPLANHLASFFLLHPPVMLFIRATIMTSIFPSLSNRSQSVGSPWLSFWPGFVTSFNRQAEELIFIPIPPLTVNLWGLLIQTQRGRGNWSYLASLSGIPRDNSIYLYIYIAVTKLSDHSRGWPEGSLFNSYYSKV